MKAILEHDATAERFANLEIDDAPPKLVVMDEDPAVELARKLRDMRAEKNAIEKRIGLVEGRLKMALGLRPSVSLGDGTTLVVARADGNIKWKDVASALSFHVSEDEFQAACEKHVGEAYVKLTYVKQ